MKGIANMIEVVIAAIILLGAVSYLSPDFTEKSGDSAAVINPFEHLESNESFRDAVLDEDISRIKNFLSPHISPYLSFAAGLSVKNETSEENFLSDIVPDDKTVSTSSYFLTSVNGTFRFYEVSVYVWQ